MFIQFYLVTSYFKLSLHLWLSLADQLIRVNKRKDADAEKKHGRNASERTSKGLSTTLFSRSPRSTRGRPMSGT